MNPRLSESESGLRTRARELAEEEVAPRAASVDADVAVPEDLHRELAAAGLIGETVGEGEVDGPVALALIVEEIARASASVGAVLAARAGRVAMLVDGHGSDGQRAAVLRQIVDGGLPTACLGGDGLAGRPAVRETDGHDLLAGEAGFVTGAHGAELLLVAATRDGEAGGEATEAFLLPVDRDGVEVGEEEPKLGLNGAGIAPVVLDGVRCGEEDRIGGASAATDLHADLVDIGRIGSAAVALGVAQAALDAAIAHVREYPDAGKSQAVQWMLADSATEIEAARTTLWYAATQEGAERSESAVMARWLAAEAAVSSARRAVQVVGDGATLRSGSLERLYRDAKLLEVHDGSSESQLREAARHLLPELVDEA